MVLNVACVLAQRHEAASGVVPRGAVLLYRVLVTRFSWLCSLEVRSFPPRRWGGARGVGFVLTLRVFLKHDSTLGKEERGFRGIPGSSH